MFWQRHQYQCLVTFSSLCARPVLLFIFYVSYNRQHPPYVTSPLRLRGNKTWPQLLNKMIRIRKCKQQTRLGRYTYIEKPWITWDTTFGLQLELDFWKDLGWNILGICTQTCEFRKLNDVKVNILNSLTDVGAAHTPLFHVIMRDVYTDVSSLGRWWMDQSKSLSFSC